MSLKLEYGTDRITCRAGMILVDPFGKRVSLSADIDRAFGLPGSNRGRLASEYVMALVEMAIDGAETLAHIRSLENDGA